MASADGGHKNPLTRRQHATGPKQRVINSNEKKTVFFLVLVEEKHLKLKKREKYSQDCFLTVNFLITYLAKDAQKETQGDGCVTHVLRGFLASFSALGGQTMRFVN